MLKVVARMYSEWPWQPVTAARPWIQSSAAFRRRDEAERQVTITVVCKSKRSAKR
jgi:hypothetical protein